MWIQDFFTEIARYNLNFFAKVFENSLAEASRVFNGEHLSEFPFLHAAKPQEKK